MLVDPTTSSTAKQPRAFVYTIWDIAVLCQQDTGDAIQCSGRKTNKNSGCGYKSFATNFNEFHKIQGLPMEIHIERLDNGEGD